MKTPFQLLNDYPFKADLQYSDPEEAGKEQQKRIRFHLDYLFSHSPFYSKKFKDAGLTPEDFQSVEDLVRFPFTDKDDLRLHNSDFLAVEETEITDVCLTSATTGSSPTALLQTPRDLSRLSYNEEIAFRTAGIGKDDTLLVCAALDRCFMAGLAYFLGGTSLGCRIIRGGSGNAVQIWELIKHTRPTVLVGVPSFLLKVAEYGRSDQADPSSFGVRKILAIGEAVRDKNLKLMPKGERLEELWRAPIFSTYASTELATTYCECSQRQGGHVRPELIYTEIVDDDGRILPAGEAGEVVVTPLGVQGMPLLRFRTGDIAFLLDEPCACGRTSRRISPVLGRKNQMLKYKGTTIFPGMILDSLEGVEGVAGGYVEARTAEDGSDDITAVIAVNDSGKADENRLLKILQAKCRVMPRLKIVDLQTYENTVFMEGKRKRVTFFDKRGLDE